MGTDLNQGRSSVEHDVQRTDRHVRQLLSVVLLCSDVSRPRGC